jgi:hypothetical protein
LKNDYPCDAIIGGTMQAKRKSLRSGFGSTQRDAPVSRKLERA